VADVIAEPCIGVKDTACSVPGNSNLFQFGSAEAVRMERLRLIAPQGRHCND